MKKLYTLIIASLLTVTAFNASAQSSSSSNDGDFSQLIKSSPGDATKLMQAYANPLFKGFGIGLNSGWNNTAATKKFLHFDIRITANVAQVPTNEQSFDVTTIGLSPHVVPHDPSQKIAPTFGGDKNATPPTLDIYNDAHTQVITSFTMPKGIIQYVPAPNVQFTIGLFKNTDVTVRTTPTINLGSDAGSVSMFGFGIKHDIIQDFAKKGHPKPFDLAFAVNYNRINYTKTLDVKPDAGAQPLNAQQSTDFSNQRISATFSGFNVQAIISKRLLFFTPFASVGFQTANTNLGVLGNFPITSDKIAGTQYYTTYKDPVSINQNSLSGMRGDVGFQMNLLILRIYASYSVGGGYNSANAGVGLGF